MTSARLDGPPMVKISAQGEDFFVRRELFWEAEGALLFDLLRENGSIAEVQSGELSLSCGPKEFTNLLHYSIAYSKGLHSEVDFYKGPILHSGFVVVSEEQLKILPANDGSRFLGRGTFGEVVRGKALWLRGAEVAVKLVDEENDAYKEASYLHMLRLPNIVSLQAVVTGDRFGLVLELTESGNLAEILYDTYNFSMCAPFAAAIKLAEALAFMHARGVVNRDLKPSNILLGGISVGYFVLLGTPYQIISIEENAKLCDFGTATTDRPEMTNNCGTTVYMAPEVFMGTKYNFQCDVYSFGIFLYELFERRRAFEGWNSYAIMLKVSEGIRPQTQNLRDCGPGQGSRAESIAQLFHLVKMCWEANPEDRPSMWTVAEKLREADALFRVKTPDDVDIYSAAALCDKINE